MQNLENGKVDIPFIATVIPKIIVARLIDTKQKTDGCYASSQGINPCSGCSKFSTST